MKSKCLETDQIVTGIYIGDYCEADSLKERITIANQPSKRNYQIGTSSLFAVKVI